MEERRREKKDKAGGKSKGQRRGRGKVMGKRGKYKEKCLKRI